MLTLFSPRPKKAVDRLEVFSQQLGRAFAQIKTDITELNSKVESQQSDLDRINQWVGYLHRYGQKLSDSHSLILQKYDKISENHKKLHSSHEEHALRHGREIEDLRTGHKALHDQLHAHKEELKKTVVLHVDSHRELTKHEIEGLKGWISHVYSSLDSDRQKQDALKRDMANAQEAWNRSYSALKELVSNLRYENDSLKKDLSELSVSLQGARSDVDQTKNMVRSHISEAESERSRPAPVPIQSQVVPQVAPQVIPQLVPQVQIAQQVYPTSGFERHIISRVLPNRRSYVLKFILDLASENRFSTKEIESIVVDEKRLCGRTSFYAYLKELKYRGQISSANIDERSIIVSAGSKPQQVQKTFDEIVENLDRSS